MSNICSDHETYDDEFECSECDFKCLSEDEMIEHSGVHRCSNLTGNGIVNDAQIDSSKHDSNNEEPNHKLQTILKRESHVDITEINNLESFTTFIKSEPILHEDIDFVDINQDSKIKIKDIKLEYNQQTHNKHDVKPGFLSKSLGYTSHPFPNPSMIFTEITERNLIYSACTNRNICNEDEIVRAKNTGVFIPECYKNVSSQHHLGALKHLKRSRLPPLKEPVSVSHFKIEVDNSGIYIPPGWKRQVFMRTKIYNGRLQFDCAYFTKQGKKIDCISKACAFLGKNPLENFVPEKLNFSTASNLRLLKNLGYPDQTSFEFDVINTGIYIPEGWKRKLKVSINDKPVMDYYIIYISPEGNKFRSETEVNSYILYSDSNLPIEVENFNFSNNCELNFIQKNSSELRNPMLTVSSYNNPEKCQFSTKTEGNLFYSICKNGNSDNIEIDEENVKRMYNQLTIKKYNAIPIKYEKTFRKIEVKVDNTGKYIPKGWQRKVLRHTKGVKKGKTSVVYISPSGKILTSKGLVKDYIEKVQIAGLINVERMDFTMSSHNLSKKKIYRRIEIKVDNTGKYIPEGWKRKLYQPRARKGNIIGRVVVVYISPLGKSFHCKKEVSDYFEDLKRDGVTEVLNIEDMDFIPPPNKLHVKVELEKTVVNKKEIKVDNSKVYIPEGWQRKCYQYTSGKSKGLLLISYISPCGRNFSNKTQLSSYIEDMKVNGNNEVLDIEYFNFSKSIQCIKSNGETEKVFSQC